MLRAWKGMTPGGMPGKFSAGVLLAPCLESAGQSDENPIYALKKER
ncbi:hypothetical protein HMPREF3213_03591 [Heyndrickxia coagulans]|uniref:Uncharacterized protein n=1 Tax=Heyndrickxia coagulans TaxID=1398 RepID=A0A133KBR6_HEYCO|nr:hypothetical protein HMPREF3213_03591 [Heyndrickxia coagulans]